MTVYEGHLVIVLAPTCHSAWHIGDTTLYWVSWWNNNATWFHLFRYSTNIWGGQWLWSYYSLEVECSLFYSSYSKFTNSNANSSRFSWMINSFLWICSPFYFYSYLLLELPLSFISLKTSRDKVWLSPFYMPFSIPYPSTSSQVSCVFLWPAKKGRPVFPI